MATMMAGMITEAPVAKTMILAGNANVTLVSRKTGTRFTYRVKAAEGDDGKPTGRWFVSVLSGSNNENDYSYMGMVFGDSALKPTRASRVGPDAPSFKAFDWALGAIRSGAIPTTLEVWHSGRCCRCGRKLTVPESIATGLGPDCAGKV